MNDEVIYEGFCANLPFNRGDKVRVRKGATIISTHPKKPDLYLLARSQVVTVHHTMPGQSYDGMSLSEIDREWLEIKGFGDQLEQLDLLLEDRDLEAARNFKIHSSNPRVVWTGTGGYWFEADINDVEPAD